MGKWILVLCLLWSSVFHAQELELKEYFPMKLFFANDEPNPRTNLPETHLTYSETYDSYQSQFDDYLKEGEQFSYLLDGDIKPNQEKLKSLQETLLDTLNIGKRIVLTVKGYASPLYFSDYNVNISKRRIQTFINELKSNSELNSHLKSKQLIIEKLPFGEHSANESVNDELDSTHLSVYHLQASYERRIEVELAYVLDQNEAVLFSENAFHDAGKVKREEVVKHQFSVENLGEDILNIDQIAVSCGCSLAETNLQKLKAGEETKLNVEIDTKDLVLGKQVKSITVKYNKGKSKRFVILVDVVD